MKNTLILQKVEACVHVSCEKNFWVLLLEQEVTSHVGIFGRRVWPPDLRCSLAPFAPRKGTPNLTSRTSVAVKQTSYKLLVAGPQTPVPFFYSLLVDKRLGQNNPMV